MVFHVRVSMKILLRRFFEIPTASFSVSHCPENNLFFSLTPGLSPVRTRFVTSDYVYSPHTYILSSFHRLNFHSLLSLSSCWSHSIMFLNPSPSAADWRPHRTGSLRNFSAPPPRVIALVVEIKPMLVSSLTSRSFSNTADLFYLTYP